MALCTGEPLESGSPAVATRGEGPGRPPYRGRPDPMPCPHYIGKDSYTSTVPPPVSTGQPLARSVASARLPALRME
jgi:hypothetical protein